MKKPHITFTAWDRDHRAALLATGALPVCTCTRAAARLDLDRGKPRSAGAAPLGVPLVIGAAGRDKYISFGLACRPAAPRAGRPIVLDGAQRAKRTALAGSDAPAGPCACGSRRWLKRLLRCQLTHSRWCHAEKTT